MSVYSYMGELKIRHGQSKGVHMLVGVTMAEGTEMYKDSGP